MKNKFKILERHQLQQKISMGYQNRESFIHFKEGWISAIRKTFDMTTYQLAKKLNLSQSRVCELEKSEISGATTLKTLRSIAESLGFHFEYAFIPLKPIEQIIQEKAIQVATEKVTYVSYQMDLEAQGISEEERQKQIAQLVREYVENPRKLWD